MPRSRQRSRSLSLRRSDSPGVARYFHHPVLGTNLIIGVDLVSSCGAAELDDLPDQIDRVVTDEIARLEAMFTIFDPSSELERWKRGELDQPSPEFNELMMEAAGWVAASGGAFHPLAAELSTCWRQGETNGRVPDPDMIAAIVDRLADPGFAIVAGVPIPTDDVSAFQLHALGKGWIVDRATERALAHARDAVGDRPELVLDIIVNAGGDLTHRGPRPIQIAIEHPLRVHDNEPPIDRVEIGDAGLATSGRARQGFLIDGDRYSHVIDPRTGYPVDHHASISVVAPSAGMADVIATIAGVEPTEVALAIATEYQAACMVVSNDGICHANDRWRRLQS